MSDLPARVTKVVVDLLAYYCGVEKSFITMDLRVQEDLGLDSIDAAAMLIVLQEFVATRDPTIEIEVSSFEAITTVGGIVETVVAILPADVEAAPL